MKNFNTPTDQLPTTVTAGQTGHAEMHAQANAAIRALAAGIPSKVSELEDDRGLVTTADLEAVDVLTTSDLDPYAKTADVPAAAVAAVGGKLWHGTQAAYDAITNKDVDTYYFIEG